MPGSRAPLRQSSGARDDRASPLVLKLAAYTALTTAELAAFDQLHEDTRSLAAGCDIITEGYRYITMVALRDGVAIRYRVLRDGRRQVLSVALPGDFIGFPACFFETARYSITALTDTIVSAIPFARLSRVFAEQPRTGAALCWLFSCEAAMYAEHLIGVSRRSAVERIAYFLLELLTRLRVIGLADESSFHLPLTQEQIGDILGLTGVHVSRTLRQLRAEGLVETEGQRVTICNTEQLSVLADFERTYLNHFRMNEALLPEQAALLPT